MIRSTASKVMWVGRTTASIVGLAIALALVLGVATTALAAMPGDPFRLGQINTINALTQLVGNRNGPMLTIDNNSTEDGASALNLQVDSGNPPIKANASSGTATGLSADRLDNKDSRALPVTIFGQSGFTHVCATKVNPPLGQWNECTPVTVKVPAGERYNVTVLSSFAATSPSNTSVDYCIGLTQSNGTQTCVGLASTISLAANYAESTSDSTQKSALSAGTYRFSTLISPGAALGSGPTPSAHSGTVTTRVFVTDASAPGPPIN